MEVIIQNDFSNSNLSKTGIKIWIAHYPIDKTEILQKNYYVYITFIWVTIKDNQKSITFSNYNLLV